MWGVNSDFSTYIYSPDLFIADEIDAACSVNLELYAAIIHLYVNHL